MNIYYRFEIVFIEPLFLDTFINIFYRHVQRWCVSLNMLRISLSRLVLIVITAKQFLFGAGDSQPPDENYLHLVREEKDPRQ